MGFDITRIFLPSKGVDMIFNMDSQAPYSRASIIYDTDFKSQVITIAQPIIPFSKNTLFKELHMTAIQQAKNRKIRVGMECSIVNLVDRYALASKKNVAAVMLKYKLPVKEINIRSAFRLPISKKYIIKSKLLYKGNQYQSPENFSIKDISLAGLGLVIPKRINNQTNPLSQIKTNEKIAIGVILINMDLDKPVGALPMKGQIKRISPAFSTTQIMAGLEVITLKKGDETLLNKFIHDAQIDELKRLSRIKS